MSRQDKAEWEKDLLAFIDNAIYTHTVENPPPFALYMARDKEASLLDKVGEESCEIVHATISRLLLTLGVSDRYAPVAACPCPFCGHWPAIALEPGAMYFATCLTTGCPIALVKIPLDQWNRYLKAEIREEDRFPEVVKNVLNMYKCLCGYEWSATWESEREDTCTKCGETVPPHRVKHLGEDEE